MSSLLHVQGKFGACFQIHGYCHWRAANIRVKSVADSQAMAARKACWLAVCSQCIRTRRVHNEADLCILKAIKLQGVQQLTSEEDVVMSVGVLQKKLLGKL